MRTQRTMMLACLAGLAGLAVSALAAAPAADTPRAAVEAQFLAQHPGAEFFRTGSAITTISGVNVSFGQTAQASAEAFIARNAGLFGVTPDQLVPGSLAADNAHLREFMPDRVNGGMKFTLVSYLQTVDGIPVYNGNIRLTVRNMPGNPLVSVRSAIFDLGTFALNADAVAAPNVAGAFADAMARFPGIGNFTPPQGRGLRRR